MAMKISSGIAEQAEEAEQEGEALADRSGDAGGARPAELHRQQRPQHAAAVHRKGRDEIENGEKQVGVGEAGEERHAAVVEPRQIGGIERADQQQQDDGDDEIDRRPGDGDGEFLRRLSGSACRLATPPIGSSVTSDA